MTKEMLVRAALFVRDLLGHNEQLIRIGRDNFERTDFDASYITIDALGPVERIGRLEDYDGINEVMSHGAVWRGVVTIRFYGPQASSLANEFSLRCMSQAALELRRSIGFNIYTPSQVIDVSSPMGQQYSDMIEVSATAEMSLDIDISTLRIDIAQIEVWTEQGVQYTGEV